MSHPVSFVRLRVTVPNVVAIKVALALGVRKRNWAIISRVSRLRHRRYSIGLFLVAELKSIR